jgi:hypothetical protein
MEICAVMKVQVVAVAKLDFLARASTAACGSSDNTPGADGHANRVLIRIVLHDG